MDDGPVSHSPSLKLAIVDFFMEMFHGKSCTDLVVQGALKGAFPLLEDVEEYKKELTALLPSLFYINFTKVTYFAFSYFIIFLFSCEVFLIFIIHM